MNARTTVRNPEMAALLEQYSARFNARRAEAYAAPETWTPKAVGEAMVEAVRWAQWAAGQVGPGGIKTVSLAASVIKVRDAQKSDTDTDLPP